MQDTKKTLQTLHCLSVPLTHKLIPLLGQMGEQLMCKTNPNSDLVKKQLSQVRDLWQTLKQTAANQTKALGGARNLHEFNRKVERLEAWIKEKVDSHISPLMCYTNYLSALHSLTLTLLCSLALPFQLATFSPCSLMRLLWGQQYRLQISMHRIEKYTGLDGIWFV